MLGLSRLYFGHAERSDELRYSSVAHARPIVVWNVTPDCNLSCRHCYAAAGDRGGVLTTEEAFGVVDDLASFGVPALLLSGGEPFMRPDVMRIARYAHERGIRITFSTNGTLIDDCLADEIMECKVAYVGISIDGTRDVHDVFRNCRGAYDSSVAAVRRLKARGVRVGLRVTMTRGNVSCLSDIFDLIMREKIDRVCFYHLVYSGRGSSLIEEDLSAEERVDALGRILDGCGRCRAGGHNVEVLTVDNHVDGIWLYGKMVREGNPRADEVLELLKRNGGNSSGIGIGCISWNGEVYPDQFWRNRSLGNVRDRKFSEIWSEAGKDSFLAMLRNRHAFLPAKCKACKWLDCCNGNFRARGEAVSGDPWHMDPACFVDLCSCSF